ncbi:branched-chain amino acid transporter permease [Alkalimarinus alittae]|uniref:AzlD domain-containing protein n=1 Tax=Alkalimarinus alittae TaxID=2961619 RepID=A0ABY6N404_9ALTE|nr:AzlD domain-containing protein [Alkalimarinus alittae]UZE96735.1 AzlD domain-containing protein [Alkalimarinus alittae]
MDNIFYLISFILTMSLATFVTRAAPFILFHKQGEHPLLVFLGRYLPPAIMLLLLIYCVKDINWFVDKGGVNELIALSVVTAAHLMLRNPLISILCGTGLYMFLQQSA